LKGQIRSEAIALLVPTRLVVLGQSKGLNRIARLGVMIYGVVEVMVVELTQVPKTQVGSDVKRIARVEIAFL
jgi:hypothetical protein